MAEGYKKTLIDEMKRGIKKQDQKLLSYKSKIIFYSLQIISFIQDVVDKKKLLLNNSNSPYMQNSCCNESVFKESCLEYFIKEKTRNK